jgi:hypothetical protein
MRTLASGNYTLHTSFCPHKQPTLMPITTCWHRPYAHACKLHCQLHLAHIILPTHTTNTHTHTHTHTCTQPMAELQRPSQTPGALQRGAARAARAATAAGFDDHELDDLPGDLPDPMMISPSPAPPPPSVQSRVSVHTCVCVCVLE